MKCTPSNFGAQPDLLQVAKLHGTQIGVTSRVFSRLRVSARGCGGRDRAKSFVGLRRHTFYSNTAHQCWMANICEALPYLACKAARLPSLQPALLTDTWYPVPAY